MLRHILIAVLLITVLVMQSHAGVGEAAVVTMSFPHSASSYAMGEVGTALADEEDVLFWNPAGLGVWNPRWHGGAVGYFKEQLLPVIGIKDLYHLSVSGVYQPRLINVGGFSTDWNFINMGFNELTDELGKVFARVHSYEWVLTTGWGFELAEFNLPDNHLGLSLKYVHSALAPGIAGANSDAGTGRTVAVDVGYLWLFGDGFRYGLTFMNMGPSIFYINENQADPIPFTVNWAIAYKKKYAVDDIEVCGLRSEFRISREFVTRSSVDSKPDPFFVSWYKESFTIPVKELFNEANYSIGAELSLFNIGYLRTGFLFDWTGERYETHLGAGVNVFDHFRLDWYYIHSPEGYLKKDLVRFDRNKEGATGVRHQQVGLQLTATSIGYWPFPPTPQYKTRKKTKWPTFRDLFVRDIRKMDERRYGKVKPVAVPPAKKSLPVYTNWKPRVAPSKKPVTPGEKPEPAPVKPVKATDGELVE